MFRFAMLAKILALFFIFSDNLLANPAFSSNSLDILLLDTKKKDLKIPLQIPPPPSKWPLEITKNSKIFKPDIATIQARIQASMLYPEYADPIQLKLNTNNINNFVKQLTNDSQFNSMRDNKPSSDPLRTKNALDKLEKRISDNSFTITPEDLSWISMDRLANILQLRTAAPSFKVGDWEQAESLRNDSLPLYFGTNYQEVKQTIEEILSKNPDQELIPFSSILPKTVRKLYGKYSHLRGRNCFGTALDFANPRNIYNDQINIEIEKGHYLTMINSDEFLQALWLGYYELSSEDILSGLRWGDIAVLYDRDTEFSWTAVKHAMVHLAGNYYFQKASKSAASPIEITEWETVIDVWTNFVPNLDYKVYRRLPARSGIFLEPQNAVERLLWTH